MLILPDRNLVRNRFLMPIRRSDWQQPSQRTGLYQIETKTRFRLRARLHDGHVVWIGWFDDRDDLDAFLIALMRGSIWYERALWDLPMPAWRPDFGEQLTYDFVTTRFITTTNAANQTDTIPADFNSANNTLEVIAGGGGGGNGGTDLCGCGAGGAAYVKSVNLSLTPSGSATFRLEAAVSAATAGKDAWYNASAFPASGQAAGAKGGGAGGTQTNGAGGAAASSYAIGTGSVTNSGGAGGTNTTGARSGSGGGGAAGLNGAGGRGGNASGAGASAGTGGGGNGGGSAGVDNTTNATGTNGGDNFGGTGHGTGGSTTSNGTNGGGGGGITSNVTAGANPAGGAGGAGTEWDASDGSGGGGGGGGGDGFGSGSAGAGGAAANYGGGGGGGGGAAAGGSTGAGGAGAQGIIVMIYTPGGTTTAKTITVTQPKSVFFVKNVGHITSITQSKAASVRRSVGKLNQITQSKAATVTRRVGKNILATKQQTVSATKRVGKLIIATQSKRVALQKTIGKILLTTKSIGASVVKTTSKRISISQSKSLILQKTIAVSKLIQQSKQAQFTKTAGKNLSITQAKSTTWLEQLVNTRQAINVIAIDPAYGSDEVTRFERFTPQQGAPLNQSCAVLVAAGEPLQSVAPLQMVFTRPDGTAFTRVSPFTYIGAVDAWTLLGRFYSGTYSVTLFGPNELNQLGAWQVVLVYGTQHTATQTFQVI